MYNYIDETVIDSYNTALYNAAEWFMMYLREGHTFDDWVNSGMERFLETLGK